MSGTEKIDFEAEGLLEGLDGDARRARLQLLEELVADGVPLAELKEANEEGRLALLPAERVMARDATMTPAEAAERAGVDVEWVLRQSRSIGLPQPEPDKPSYSDQDVEAFQLIKSMMEGGIAEEDILDIGRVIGHGTWRVAQAQIQLIGETFLRTTDNERDLAMGFAAAAETLAPMQGRLIETALAAHLRNGIREVMVTEAERATGRGIGTREITVCFADLVGFTRLGEEIDVADLGGVAGRLEKMTAETIEQPVRLVKTIGDAVMLASPEPRPLLDSALELVENADSAGDGFPQLRVGIDHGPAIPRGGDWFGRVVNVASRVTGIARPSSVLATNEVRESVGDDAYAWSEAGVRHLKGVTEPVGLNRLRRAEPEAEGSRN